LLAVIGMLVAGLVLTLAGPALAASPKGKRTEPPKLTRPMRVLIVADSRAGCEPNCAEWISAEGEIGPDTPALFSRAFKALGDKKLPLFISSSGGSVKAALAIGREIRKRKLDVVVERTVFQRCEPTPSACDREALKDGDKGRPQSIGAYCVSACVFILAGGIQRVVPAYGFVGLHEIVAFRTYRRVRQMYRVVRGIENGRPVEVSRQLVSQQALPTTTVETDPDYAPIRAYLTEMGVDTATIIPLMLATPRTGVHRMTPEERLTSRLVTRVGSGTELLPRATQAGAVEVAAVDAAAAKPIAAPAQRAAALSGVLAELTLFYPPAGETVEIYIQLKSSGPEMRTDQFFADIQLGNGARAVARNIGGGAAEPLYATLTYDDFCALSRSGESSLKIALRATENPGRARMLAYDLAKSPSFAEFAAKRCGKRVSSALPQAPTGEASHPRVKPKAD